MDAADVFADDLDVCKLVDVCGGRILVVVALTRDKEPLASVNIRGIGTRATLLVVARYIGRKDADAASKGGVEGRSEGSSIAGLSSFRKGVWKDKTVRFFV